ncbi:MAG: PH domain-containing protein [Halobacteriales archaeon]
MNRLHPRIRLIWMLRTVILAIVFGGLGTGGYVFFDLPPALGGAAFSIVLLIGLPMAFLRYRKWRYEIREDAVYLERGVLTEVRTVVPFVRIQHVDSRRGPLERLTGLASTVVYTAGSRGADVRIPGLSPSNAQDLRERLKRLAIESEGEDAV